MYGLDEDDGCKSRCLFTKIELSSNLNYEHPPMKKKPFSVVTKQPFTHTLQVLLPKPTLEAFRRALGETTTGTLKYAKLHMKLSDIIRGDFFTHYIKSGNIALLSPSRRGIDPHFSLWQGVLRLEVDKPTFERMGLEGKPLSPGQQHHHQLEGRKHIKSRYLVELNLRLPSMVRGRKGFERVVRAFEDVLDFGVTWLFCDLGEDHHDGTAKDGAGAGRRRPIDEHQPKVYRVEGDFVDLGKVKVPGFPVEVKEEEDFVEAAELLEWLSLAINESPRVREGDEVDPVLSRYQVPYWLGGGEDASQLTTQDLVKVKWRGLITPQFATGVLLAAMKVSKQRWMAMNASQFNGEGYSILVTNNKYLVWEYKD